VLSVILDAAQTCAGGAVISTYGDPPAGAVQHWFNRIVTKTPGDAQRMAQTFRSIGGSAG
jgi:hypothetical protein